MRNNPASTRFCTSWWVASDGKVRQNEINANKTYPTHQSIVGMGKYLIREKTEKSNGVDAMQNKKTKYLGIGGNHTLLKYTSKFE